MKLIVKVLIVFAVVISASMITLSVYELFTLEPDCTIQIIREIPSPDGKFKVVLFSRDCGGGTSKGSHVSLLKTTEVVGQNSTGNLFIADCNDGTAPPAAWGGPDIGLQWVAPDSLVVTYDPKVKVYRKRNVSGDLKLGYLEKYPR